jgi:hypothetical protein
VAPGVRLRPSLSLSVCAYAHLSISISFSLSLCVSVGGRGRPQHVKAVEHITQLYTSAVDPDSDMTAMPQWLKDSTLQPFNQTLFEDYNEMGACQPARHSANHWHHHPPPPLPPP